MDEFEISIERGSNEQPRPKSEMPQMNPRIAAVAAGIFILALVMWLGAQTPGRTTVESSTTTTVVFESSTSTTETQFAAPPLSNVVDLSSPSMLEWLADLEANPPEALSVLSSPVFLFVYDRNGGGRLVELSPGEVTSTELICRGQSVEWVMGQVGGSLIVTSVEATCWVNLDRLDEVVVIPGARAFPAFAPSGPDTGWFCEPRSETSARIVEFAVESGLGASYETSSCPGAAEGELLLLYDRLAMEQYLWKVGDPVDRKFRQVRESCEAIGYSLSGAVCRVGSDIEIRDYFSEDTVTFPTELSSDAIGQISISPDRRKLLLQVSEYQPDASFESSFVIVNVDTGEPKWLAGNFRNSSGTWHSNSELLIHDYELVGTSPACSKGLTMFDSRSGLGTRLLDYPLTAGLQVLVLDSGDG